MISLEKEKKIREILDSVDFQELNEKYFSSGYGTAIEECLMWILDEIPDGDFYIPWGYRF